MTSPPPERRLLTTLSHSFSLVLIAAGVGLAAFITILVSARAPGPLEREKIVLLTYEDETLAHQLEKAGVISNAFLFSAITWLDTHHNRLKRGEYKFPAGISMHGVEEMLIQHRVVKYKVPVPEGLSSAQIVDRLQGNEVLSGEIATIPPEGSLLPSTYIIERGETRKTLLAQMSAAMTSAVKGIWAQRAPNLPLQSPRDLVALASIVEKETGKAEERPLVASVFINRLHRHMKLQSDPTIVYGLVYGKGALGHSLTAAEVQSMTPYNTYVIEGLPPGPICNPGRAALLAAAHPSQSDALYFVADGSGGHAFAETLEEHQKNVLHWRQIEKNLKDAAPAHSENEGSHFGLLPRVGGESVPLPEAKALAIRLAAIAAARRQIATLTTQHDTLESLVVTGVNDPSPEEDAPVDTAPIESAPLSPKALADLQARVARYSGNHAPVSVNKGSVSKSSAFDASQGTSLDPLLNTTYDLTHAKDVPKLF